MSEVQNMPPQHQETQPGKESAMEPQPSTERDQLFYRLEGKSAVITGGDSGIGRAVAIAFAEEGADVLLSYLNEEEDALETKKRVEYYGVRCELIAGDISEEAHCKQIAGLAMAKFGKIDILVNNAAQQFPQDRIEDITEEQLTRTFRTNIFSYFFLSKAVIPFMKEGSSIINTTSVTAYKGSKSLLDYSSTKGAIVAFTRSLSQQMADRGIRVNGVAPGPVWTPLIPSTFPPEKVEVFGKEVPMKRPGQPEEIAPAYVFLASEDSSFMSGQVMHPNGGEIINA